MGLNSYLAATQRLLGTGSAGNLYTTADLTVYINTARKQVAVEGECVRTIPPISGPITALTITSGGSGYGITQIVIGTPDSPPHAGALISGAQASATATTGAGGTVATVSLSGAGNGYFAPAVSVSDGAGTGAVIVATVSGICQTSPNQEVYPFSQFNPIAAVSGSGIASIYELNSITLIWGTWRQKLARWGFSEFQVRFRSAMNFFDVPAAYCQFGQGGMGSVYLGPIPNANYQMEWDCICLPTDLTTDTDVDAVPPLWQDAVPFYAAYLAFTQAQRFQDADRMWKEYNKFMVRARQLSSRRSAINRYGRAY